MLHSSLMMYNDLRGHILLIYWFTRTHFIGILTYRDTVHWYIVLRGQILLLHSSLMMYILTYGDTFYWYIDLRGHILLLHSSPTISSCRVIKPLVSHVNPSPDGAGLVHERWRRLSPPPHVREQGVQSVHNVHWPSTVSGTARKNHAFKTRC